MILKEFEGKQLLREVGLQVPPSILVRKSEIFEKQKLLSKVAQCSFPVYVKSQVLHGNRELQGLVKKVTSVEGLISVIVELFEKNDQFGQEITELLIEEQVAFSDLIYLSVGYDTQTRSPVFYYSKSGGTGMDERGSEVSVEPFSIINGVTNFNLNQEFLVIAQKLFSVFVENDASLVEVNPIAVTQEGFVCLDAKIELEEVARFRHPEWEEYGTRAQIAKPLTEIEKQANAVSRMDSRGVAGESFFEFPGGTVGVMASGGGASTLAMDALLSEGLLPANYTEYSGNPTKEKVTELTKIVLSLTNVNALYVVGSNANFTDILRDLIWSY